MIIGIVSQKGGVGKSTLARMLAREYAAAKWNVLIADMDVSQGTSFNWQARRLEINAKPEISVQKFHRVGEALKAADHYDLTVFDGAPHASKATIEIAKAANLIILPTGIAIDDLEPTVRLGYELKKQRIDASRIAVAFCRVGDSEVELSEAADYIQQAGITLLNGAIPERTAYRRASDLGKSITETTYSTLNQKAADIGQSVINIITKLEKKGAA